jgi:energy-coupling factor transporter ATP-binding protein EcfA2/uncharacterized membrane protein
MEAFGIDDLTFSYPESAAPALSRVSLSIESGEFVALCGASGCGKTTLLRLLKRSIAPRGETAGTVRFMGKPLDTLPQREECGGIGFVFQNAEEQIVTDRVWHELAFGLESLGLERGEIRRRAAETAEFFGIGGLFERDVATLSGGQKQLLCLASALVTRPAALLLDEPTSMLDPIAAAEFVSMLKKINRELGTTIIAAEQRLEELLPESDRVVVMDSGSVVFDGEPAACAAALARMKSPMLRAMPTPARVFCACGGEGGSPVSVREGRRWLEKYINTRAPAPLAEKTEKPRGEALLSLRGAWLRYGRDGDDVLRGADAEARRGELIAIVGGNGAGKSTLLSALCGTKKLCRGKREAAAGIRAAMLPQDVKTLFAADTVRGDLLDACASGADAAGKIQKAAELCRISALLDRHPYDLSGGEQQRAALAKILITDPDVLLLDEPTKGMDAPFREEFARTLRELCAAGKAVVMVSHDVEFCAEHADRCAMLFDGAIVSEAAPREFFSTNSFYTTAARRMARGIADGAVTCADVIEACGGRPERTEPPDAPPPPPESSAAKKSDGNNFHETRSRTGLSKALEALFLALVPLTVCLGTLGGRSWFYVSVIAIAELLAAFAARYEGRRPPAREIAVVAALCALAVAGRAAFFMVPQFKPVAAIAILAGAGLGGEAGFAVGALSAFVSNFMFGQGPWTPWQMLGFGAVGLISGALFSGRKNAGTIPLCVYGALSVLLLYGPLNDISGVLMYQSAPNLALALAALLSGLPFNAVHAAATVFFLLLLAKPMLKKLTRLRVKYGITPPARRK